MRKPPVPRYYRQRFLLVLLEMAGGKLSKMDLQKLVFLAHREVGFDYYDFVPYHYGCYSFQLQADLAAMAAGGWLSETEKQCSVKYRAGACLDPALLERLGLFLAGPGRLRGKKLLRYVYTHYPYYATRSRIADSILDEATYGGIRIANQGLKSNAETLFTIGYESSSFEAYANTLLKNDVRLLCDVRKNPFSRKYGFSKHHLSLLLHKLGIAYEHIPALGIPASLRRSLTTAKAYDRLFAHYRERLPQKTDSLLHIEALLKRYRRIALTCFEKEHTSCHRHCISEFLQQEKNLRACHL